MGFVLVEGASITVSCDSPVVTAPISHTLTVSSSGKITVDTKKAALKSDMESQSSPAPQSYLNPPYICTGGTIQWDGILAGAFESAKLDKDGNPVIVDDAGGSSNWDVVVPAQDPTKPPSPPCVCGTNCTPDSTSSYPGTWSINSAGQTKLDTTE
jgi:hypothetical protein